MEIPVYIHDSGECPYLPDRSWRTQFFQADAVPDEVYELIINQGWRRSGNIFYKNICDGCNECTPMRVDVDAFKPSKSQRRCLKKNADIVVAIENPEFRMEDYNLFTHYDKEWHDSRQQTDMEGFVRLHVSSPITTKFMRYYCGDTLVGLGMVDVLPDSISSVYFSFDPAFSSRSLGVFSALKEIELCRSLGKKWFHLGFYIRDCEKMNYKSNYKPHQFLLDNNWTEPS